MYIDNRPDSKFSIGQEFYSNDTGIVYRIVNVEHHQGYTHYYKTVHSYSYYLVSHCGAALDLYEYELIEEIQHMKLDEV